MKKLFLSFLLTMLLCMTGETAFAADISAKNDDGVTIYYLFINDSTELAVTYTGIAYTSDKLPFENNYTGKVVIPESVTYNGKTYSVTSIGNGAFYGCTDLTSVTIPNSVTTIKGQVKWISGYMGGTYPAAFEGCTSLKSIRIPDSVTEIEQYTFTGCSNLTSIIIGNDVASIDKNAFSGTGWYNKQPNGILYFGNWLLGYKGGMPIGAVSILEGTTRMANNAFSGCVNLTSVTIPNSMTNIGSGAFSGCI